MPFFNDELFDTQDQAATPSATLIPIVVPYRTLSAIVSFCLFVQLQITQNHVITAAIYLLRTDTR
jgi:hypothetical protein